MPDLRGVKEIQAMAQIADGLPAHDRILQRAVQNRRRDFLLQLRGHIPDGFQQARRELAEGERVYPPEFHLVNADDEIEEAVSRLASLLKRYGCGG